MSIDQQFDPIEFLVSRRFPGRWKVLDSIWSNPERIRDESPEAISYEAELRNKTEKELSSLIEAEGDKISSGSADRHRALEAGFFFNAPNSEADFEHWGNFAHWTVEEAVTLSFGKAPEIVEWSKIRALRQATTFAANYVRRMQIIQRACSSRQLYDPVRPEEFLDWALRMDIEVPWSLRVVVFKYAPRGKDWKSRFEAETTAHEKTSEELAKYRLAQAAGLPADRDEQKSALGTRERESLLKIILGIAMDAYGYDPDATKSPTAKEIAEILTEKGIGLDEDTVRKYLHLARDLLPRDKIEAKS